MNEVEARIKGKHWIKFNDIPISLRQIYDLLLAISLPGLKEQLQRTPGVYEQACEHWLNNSINKVTQQND